MTPGFNWRTEERDHDLNPVRSPLDRLCERHDDYAGGGGGHIHANRMRERNTLWGGGRRNCFSLGKSGAQGFLCEPGGHSRLRPRSNKSQCGRNIEAGNPRCRACNLDFLHGIHENKI